jgi:hypothetical protein
MIDIKQASDEFNDAVARRIEARRALCETAIKAAARLLESQGSIPSRFPELAPLTVAERLIVARAVNAGSTGSSNGVD